MKNVFVSTYRGEWISPAKVLQQNLGFNILELEGKVFPSISSKKILLKKELHNVWNVLKRFKEINHSDILICSNYVTLFLLLLKQIGLLKVKQLLWFGVYIHSPSMVSLVGKLLRLFGKKKGFKVVVFSREEINLYSKSWNMPKEAFVYVPYGQWNSAREEITTHTDEGYFFSGGYSNRDYVTLIKLFQDTDLPLVIAASRQNTDLTAYVEAHPVSSNIRIYYDINQKAFNALLEKSHCVVFIMKHNTGASGQMVVLNAMRNRKLILSTYTDCLNEYIEDQKEALVISKDALPDVFRGLVESAIHDKKLYEQITENAYQKYLSCFSYEAISRYLTKEIELIKQEITQ